MNAKLSFALVFWLALAGAGHATPIGYAFTVTTAYANGDPFADRIDQNFNEPDDGFFQVADTGDTSFEGVIGTIAVSSFAGDLSWVSGGLVLVPGASVSVAIPDDSSAVGGFNGPYYFYRPGVEIYIRGTVSDGTFSEPVDLLIADRDIHSGIPRTDPFGLVSDSFVLQGGDPWGFNNADTYALAQAYGVAVLSEPAPEPSSLALLATAGTLLLCAYRRSASLASGTQSRSAGSSAFRNAAVQRRELSGSR